jgi:protein TonB
MTPPEKLSGPEPILTLAAMAQREGMVRAACRVTVDGCVDGCRIVKSDPAMDAAYVNALQRRRYRPATLDGKSVEVEYTFRLQWKVPF